MIRRKCILKLKTTFLKLQSGQQNNYGNQQAPPPPYLAGPGNNKRFKTEPVSGVSPAVRPSFYLTSQQIETMEYLQQNAGNLTVQQQV